MGYDRRIAAAMLTLGYDLFPFEAFDGSGRIIIPDHVQYPSYLRDGLGTIAQAGAWPELYRTLSVLGRQPWGVFAAGVNFTARNTNIALFKAASSVANAQAAHQWTISYQTTLAETVRKFSGTHHVVDPKWLQWLNEALDRLPPDQKANDPAGIRPGEYGVPVGDDAPAVEDGAESLGLAVPWLLLGLRAMLGMLDKLTLGNGVRTTVFWYPTQGQVLDKAFVSRWTPVHVDYVTYPDKRAVHGVWEPVGYPRILWGTEVNWNRFSWAMPHQPWQWCRAFYPTGACGGPGLASDLTTTSEAVLNDGGASSVSAEVQQAREETAIGLGVSIEDVGYITEELLAEYANADVEDAEALGNVDQDGDPLPGFEGENATASITTYGNSLTMRGAVVWYKQGDRGSIAFACGQKYVRKWTSRPGDQFIPQSVCPRTNYYYRQLYRP